MPSIGRSWIRHNIQNSFSATHDFSSFLDP
jgi:hypothetical protein